MTPIVAYPGPDGSHSAAACEKLFFSTTATKAASWRVSIRIHYGRRNQLLRGERRPPSNRESRGGPDRHRRSRPAGPAVRPIARGRRAPGRWRTPGARGRRTRRHGPAQPFRGGPAGRPEREGPGAGGRLPRIPLAQRQLRLDQRGGRPARHRRQRVHERREHPVLVQPARRTFSRDPRPEPDCFNVWFRGNRNRVRLRAKSSCGDNGCREYPAGEAEQRQLPRRVSAAW